MNLSLIRRAALGAGMMIAGGAYTTAQDSGPLLDLLVRKGLISDQEAEDLRAELVRDFAANTSAGKLNLGSAVSEFKLSGDIRLRQQFETQAPQNTSISNDRSRTRFRFRLNGDAILQKGWGAGFALETGQAADSGNQTFENGGDDYNLYLARAYVSYQLNDNWLFVGGKQRNPFYTTDLVWDSDINPQGVAEIYTRPLGDGKDTLELRAAQILMDDNNEYVTGPAGEDAWLFAQQAVYTHWFGSDALGNKVSSLVLAPGFMTYNNAATAGLGNEGAFNGRTDKLSSATFAGEVNFANLGDRSGASLKVYWDSAYNFEAESRVRNVYGLPDADEEPFAWLIGVGYAYGKGKTQGDYSLRVDYRHNGIGALDPNLNDSDFGFSNLNQRGWKISGSYNLTDFANIAVTYFTTTDVDETLIQSAVAKLDHSRLLQLDLIVKF